MANDRKSKGDRQAPTDGIADADAGKNPLPIADQTVAATITATATSASASKRVRKARVVAVDANTNLSYTSDDDNVVLKLSFPSCAASTANAAEPQPHPYNEAVDNAFVSTPCSVVAQVSPLMPPSDASGWGGECEERALMNVGGAKSHAVVRLLTDFEEKNKNGEWPTNTSVHCYWCCHGFNNTPFGLPVKFANNRFHVIGCFCSLECASAYNFASRDSVDECLNRFTLINSLAYRLGLGRIVRPAPDRLSLSVFGGHLTIDEFRAFSRSNRHIIVNSPPMLTVTQQVEEVHENDLRSEYRYIPLDNERVNRYQEKIRLKRSKPLVNFMNTLDHSMKLKYTTVPSA